MQSKLTMIFAYLSSCAGCGYSLPPIDYLCKSCWKRIANESTPHYYSAHKWKVFTVWEWEKKNSLLHLLLKRRKGANIARVEQKLAYLLIEALPLEHRNAVDEIFYPAKPRRKRDHTFKLAHAVGEILQVPVTGIEVTATPNYKSYTRKQRAQERLKNPGTYARYKGRAPLLIDDIITTGTTLEAIWLALGRPKRTVSLCLAYKTFNPEDKI